MKKLLFSFAVITFYNKDAFCSKLFLKNYSHQTDNASPYSAPTYNCESNKPTAPYTLATGPAPEPIAEPAPGPLPGPAPVLTNDENNNNNKPAPEKVRTFSAHTQGGNAKGGNARNIF